MKLKELPTQEYLQECLDYIPETGKLFWKVRPREHFKTQRGFKIWNARYAGTQAFNCWSGGYYVGKIDRTNYLAHRVIYKLVTGMEPEILDHTKRETTDNRVESLSNGTITDNNRNTSMAENNTSGVTGVSWDASRCKWRAWIGDAGKHVYLGRYNEKEAAIAARCRAEAELGYHPNHGRDLQTVTI